jgi:retron-type reverse transcriptase
VGELKAPGKSFEISKWAVWEAWEKVKVNKGAPGVDGQSVAEFEKDLKGNLYKIWNRMSSGSYFPPPVRAVEIAKAHRAGTRILGVPTVADRVAQTVWPKSWRRRSNRSFIRTPTATAQGVPRSTRWPLADAGAGTRTG